MDRKQTGGRTRGKGRCCISLDLSIDSAQRMAERKGELGKNLRRVVDDGDPSLRTWLTRIDWLVGSHRCSVPTAVAVLFVVDWEARSARWCATLMGHRREKTLGRSWQAKENSHVTWSQQPAL